MSVFDNNIKQLNLVRPSQSLSMVLKKLNLTRQKQTRMWPMPNVMAAQPNIGGALCKSSVIPFPVPCCTVWLIPAAGVMCSDAANIGELQKLDVKYILHWAKFHQGATAPESVYIVHQPRRRPKIVQSLVGLR